MADITVRGVTEIREGFTRVVRNGLVARGVSDPDTGPLSDWHIEGQAIGEQLAVAEANSVAQGRQMLEDSATGADLERLGGLRGVTKRPAAGSYGSVVLESSISTTVVSGTQLLYATGQKYEVTVGNTYANGDLIPVRAIDQGDATNLPEDTPLKWAAPPAGASANALVGPGGLVNGTDVEDDEVYRQRVLARMRTPPKSGNPQHLAELAEGASPSVQKAFVYPGVEGPATVHIAVAAPPTKTNKSRVVATTLMNTIVRPYTQAQIPERAFSVVTTVDDLLTEIAIGLILPDPPSASPPGPGGGWLDGSPWPQPAATNTATTTDWRCAVTAVGSATQITVDAQTAPLEGSTRIAAVGADTSGWKVFTATVLSYSGTPGAYVLTLDTAWPFVEVGTFIFPQFEQQDRMLAAVLGHFQLMGPGEKTANASALLRGYRHPPPNVAFPNALDALFLRTLSENAPNVLAAQWFFRSYTGLGTPTRGPSAGRLSPPVPSTIRNPPKQFVPSRIGFYRIPA